MLPGPDPNTRESTVGSKPQDQGKGFTVEQNGTGQPVTFERYEDASRRNTQVNGLFADDPKPKSGNDGGVPARKK